MIINEIFGSISGEVCSFGQGRRCTFIRTAGCNLSCLYCDTPQTQNSKNGHPWEISKIVAAVKETGARQIVITGGEPLLQDEALCSLLKLLYMNFSYGRAMHEFVAIETNGSRPLPAIKKRFVPCWVVDYKLDMEERMCPDLHANLGPNDFIKFVIKDMADLRRAFEIQEEMQPTCSASFAYSIIRHIERGQAEWAVRPKDVLYGAEKRGLDIMINMQIHKFLGLA